MKIMVRATTGANIQVWREGDTYSAQRGGAGGAGGEEGEPQTCWGVDLFEVIAELAGLDLERSMQSEEALSLAERAIAALEEGEAEQTDQGEPPAFRQGRG